MQKNSERPTKRRLTPKQRERLRRRRRQKKIIRISIIALVCTALIASAALLLRPGKQDAPASAAPVATSMPTIAPAPTALPTAVTPTPVPTAAPSPAVKAASPTDPVLEPEPTVTAGPVSRTVRFRATGDIMITKGQLGYARSGSVYDFAPQLALIADVASNADYTIGNLETTIGKYGDTDYSGYPCFNAPESVLDAVQGAGFDFLTLANNHMLDRWFDGLVTTANNVEQWGFDFCGAYRTPEERTAACIVEINGIRFGFVSYTQSANGLESQCSDEASEFGVPFLFSADIEGDIQRLRDAGAEVVVALPHWGTEYRKKPDDTQYRYARRLAVAGADVILGSHPHVVQKVGIEVVTDADGAQRQVLVAYSLGNFISTQKHSGYTDAGIILEFTVIRDADGTISIGDVGYVPTYCWKHDGTLQVLPSSKYIHDRPEGMSDSDFSRMADTHRALTELMGDSLAQLSE